MEDRMAGFYFKLEHEDGTPADPPALHTAVPNWQVGDTIPLGREKMFTREWSNLSAINFAICATFGRS
jgi:hypothetical protein